MNKQLRIVIWIVMAVSVALMFFCGSDYLNLGKELHSYETLLEESRQNWEKIAEEKEALQEDLNARKNDLKEAQLSLKEAEERAEELKSEIRQLREDIDNLKKNGLPDQ